MNTYFNTRSAKTIRWPFGWLFSVFYCHLSPPFPASTDFRFENSEIWIKLADSAAAPHKIVYTKLRASRSPLARHFSSAKRISINETKKKTQMKPKRIFIFMAWKIKWLNCSHYTYGERVRAGPPPTMHSVLREIAIFVCRSATHCPLACRSFKRAARTLNASAYCMTTRQKWWTHSNDVCDYKRKTGERAECDTLTANSIKISRIHIIYTPGWAREREPERARRTTFSMSTNANGA